MNGILTTTMWSMGTTWEEDEFVQSLLDEYGLPTEGLNEPRVRLYIFRMDDSLAGIGGYELFDENALLTSIAVADEFRGQGAGRAITERVLNIALDAGVKRMYLMTTTAPEFFRARGFEAIPPGLVEKTVLESQKFKTLNPDTAVCMLKNLEK